MNILKSSQKKVFYFKNVILIIFFAIFFCLSFAFENFFLFAATVPSRFPSNALVASTKFKHNWLNQPILENRCINKKSDFDEEVKLTSALNNEKEQIHIQEIALNNKKMMIRTAEKKLSSQLDALKIVEAKFILLQKADEKTTSHYLLSLAKTYEVMPPRSAAKVFDKLSYRSAVNLLLQMDIRHRARILTAMKTEKSLEFTEKFLTSQNEHLQKFSDKKPSLTNELK